MRHSGKRKWPIVEREVERVWRMRVVVDLRGGWLGGFSVGSLLEERMRREEEDMVGGFGGVASWRRRRWWWWWIGWKIACSWIQGEKVSCVLRQISCTFRGSEGDVAFFFPFSPESSSPNFQNRIQRLSSTNAMNPFFFVTLLAKNCGCATMKLKYASGGAGLD